MHTIDQSSCHCSWNNSYMKVSQSVDNMARLYWQSGNSGKWCSGCEHLTMWSWASWKRGIGNLAQGWESIVEIGLVLIALHALISIMHSPWVFTLHFLWHSARNLLSDFLRHGLKCGWWPLNPLNPWNSKAHEPTTIKCHSCIGSPLWLNCGLPDPTKLMPKFPLC